MADWSFLERDDAMQAVERYARRFALAHGSYEDARHEAMAYLATHSMTGRNSIRNIYDQLSKRVPHSLLSPEPEAAPQLPPRTEEEKPQPYGTAVFRKADYTPEQVARFIPACYSLAHIESLSDPFGEELRPVVARFSSKDPSHSNTLWAVVADLRAVYRRDTLYVNEADLSEDEERSLLLTYALDLTPEMVSMFEGCSSQAYDAVCRITNHMNGV